MPGNAFIKFEGIPVAESYQKGHHGDQGWIEIGDWSWEVEAETSFLKGGGSAVGKPQPGSFTFSHYFDLGAPEIMSRIVKGTHFTDVIFDSLKQVGHDKGEPAVFFQIAMKSVFITKVSTKGSEDGSVMQDVEMVFKDISIGYKAQNNKGGLDATQYFDWSVAKMNMTSEARAKMTI